VTQFIPFLLSWGGGAAPSPDSTPVLW